MSQLTHLLWMKPKGNPNPKTMKWFLYHAMSYRHYHRNYCLQRIVSIYVHTIHQPLNLFSPTTNNLSFYTYYIATTILQCKNGGFQCIGFHVDTISCMRPISSHFHSLSFNIAPHHQNILGGTIINDIETILCGGLGLPYRLTLI